MRFVIRGIVVVLLAGAAWFTWQGYRVYSDLKKTVVVVPTAGTDPTFAIAPLNGNQRTNFLVLGSDNDRKLEEKRPLSQSMIVVSVDPKTNKVVMLSIPRDFYVPIPGHGMQKIDLAYKYGGVKLARSTVEKLFHIPIDYYAWVGLDGFIRVLNTFQGVTLNISHPILDDSYPDDLNTKNPYGYRRIFIPAGWQHLDGAQALEYVRSRHGDRLADFGRSARQQQVLLALNKKISVMNVLGNLVTLADELSTSVRTDLDLTQYYQLEQLSRKIKPSDVTTEVLSAPVYCTYAFTSKGESILRPNWPKISTLVQGLFGSRLLRSHPKPKSHSPRPPRVPTSSPTPASSHLSPTPNVRPSPTPASPSPTARPSSTPVPTATVAPLAGLPGRLIYVRGGNIFLLDRTETPHQLTFTGDAAMPSPSPDGRWIAFVRFPTGQYESNIWMLNVRTHKEHLIERVPSPREVRNRLWAVWPTWSADGRNIIFSWDRPKLSRPPTDARPVDLSLWSMDTHGGRQQQITTPVQGAGGDTEPAWRPKHNQFAYVRWNYLSNNEPYSQLVLYDGATRHTWPLTQVGGRVLQVAWDSAGNRVVFVRKNLSGMDEVVVASVSFAHGSYQLGPRTAISTGSIAQPAFSPGGRWVSYLQADGDGFSLMAAPSGGGMPRPVPGLGNDLDSRSRPVWIR